MSIVLDIGQQQDPYAAFPPANANPNTPCPICFSGTVQGIFIQPLNFNDIEKAITLKHSSKESSSSSASTINGKKHGRDEDPEIEAQSTYLLLSNNHSSFSSSNLSREQQRTGRWTSEETAFVDYLVNAFDNGSMPLPHGIKLNEFLGDILLCKSSRLTKKMKNAKLSARSFELGNVQALYPQKDRETLSTLQERFLSAITSESTRLELRFNLAKQWRTHFSNLCVQVGYPYLDAKGWVESLEEMESRATRAEDAVRRVRRRKMSEALQTDAGGGANPSVFIGGVKAHNSVSELQSDSNLNSIVHPSSEKVRAVSGDEEHTEDLNDSLAFLNESGNSFSSARARSRTLSIDFLESHQRDRAFSEDFDAVLDTLMDDEPGGTASASSYEQPKANARSTSPHSCGPFLDAIINYMETHKIPFQHADLWVPSFAPQDSAQSTSKAVDTDQLRLHHAGHASRGDLDNALAYKLTEFGVYSDNFSFEPGHGLPGRVYASGEITWERDIQNKDPKIFERAGGAKVYGLKTAVGIPLNTAMVGRIVVTMYSCEDIPENMALARDISGELAKYSPEPKWKLCIDSTLPQSPGPIATPLQMGSTDFLENQDNLTLSPMFGATEPPRWDMDNPSIDTGSAAPVNNEEQQLISLLGLHMPVEHDASAESRGQLQLYMSIRLLLLRPKSRRTSQENEMLEILKSSYGSYSKDNRKDAKELAKLLVKDWECLQKTYSFQPSTAPLAPPSMQKSLPPANRRLSLPVETRLASVPLQRRV
ncbi:MAG: hypothetical protein SGILL_001441, partial [Bacillariaceae sp.]